MLVEGIGDEVVLLLSALLAVGLIILAWLSTHVAEQQVNVILIDRRSFHTLVQRLLNHIPGRRGDRANNNTVASDNNHADTDDIPQVPDDESVPEVPPLEELFDMDITADGGDLMPVQIVGMSEMEHFINHSESEEINISGINQAVGQETTVEAVASTSATEHVSPQVDGLSDEAENNQEPHPVQVGKYCFIYIVIFNFSLHTMVVIPGVIIYLKQICYFIKFCHFYSVEVRKLLRHGISLQFSKLSKKIPATTTSTIYNNE